MKKTLILFVLLALPISIYIIFATAVHHFSYLPTLTSSVGNIKDFTGADSLQFEDKVTLLCFFGGEVKNWRGQAYNLHERVYKKNYIYKDFQIITIAQNGQEQQAKELLEDLGDFTDINMLKWHFIYGSPSQIHDLFDSLKTGLHLNAHNASPDVFIIDKERNLRGRKDEKEGVMYGYPTHSIAAINNTLVEDVSILLAEYRLKAHQKENNITKKKVGQ